MTFPFPWRQSVPGGCHGNSLLFKGPRSASPRPSLPYDTPYPIPRMWGLRRESTPAGFLLIGYFSFSLLPCLCLNFLPPLAGLPCFSLPLCVLLPVPVEMASQPVLLTFFETFCFFAVLCSLNTTPSMCHLSSSDPVTCLFHYLFILLSGATLS